MFSKLKELIFKVLITLLLSTVFNPIAFAVEYRLHLGKIYKQDHSGLFVIQVHPSTLPNNLNWTFVKDPGYWTGGYKVAHWNPPISSAAPKPVSGPSPAELARRKAEEDRRKAEAAAAEKAALEKLTKSALKQFNEEILPEIEADIIKDFNETFLPEIEADIIKDSADTNLDLRKALCFPAGTTISVKDDSPIGYHSVPIEDIKDDDVVVSCNLLHGGTCEYAPVKKLRPRTANLLYYISFGGGSIKATPEHPFYVKNRADWVEAQDLQAGDLFQTITGASIPVTQIKKESGSFTVYNLTVAGNENYYACDVLVHNCSRLAALGTTALGVGTVGAEVAAVANPVGEVILGAAATVYVGQQIYDHLKPNTLSESKGNSETTTDASSSKDSGGQSAAFPSAKEMGKKLGVSQEDFHRDIKPEILKQFKKESKQIGAKNPNIGVDDSGNIVLQHPESKKNN